jgi:fatty acid desaturase
MSEKNAKYPDIFDQLTEQVKEAGLLDRVPQRGVIEMVGILVSLVVLYATMSLWNPILMGLFLTLIFTRSVFVSHDVLHQQYFKDRKLSLNLSYPFSSLIICNSPSWWIWKHNVNHHNHCNVVEKDEDILALDGAFTPNNKGDKPFIRKYKHLIFWGALLFMYPAFIIKSFRYVIQWKKYKELGLMLLHWVVIWGPIFTILPFSSAITVFITLYFSLSLWLSLGFITNHLGCEVFNLEESKALSWMELQMRSSRSLIGGHFVHWFYGGLNTQIEHHLFPKAPRFNLLKVQQITRDFAKKHNINYFESTPIEAYFQINQAIKTY